MVQEFSGAGQPQILPGLDGAGDQPRAVWDHLHHGGRGRVWSCHLNPLPAAAASAAGARPWSGPADETQQKKISSCEEKVTKQWLTNVGCFVCTWWGSACCRTFGVNFLWFCSSCCCCCCCGCCCCWSRSWQAWTNIDGTKQKKKQKSETQTETNMHPAQLFLKLCTDKPT